MNKRLLLIAYHFPPIQGSTGVARTLATARYLRESGWDVTVLTCHPRAYVQASDDNLSLVPAHVKVCRVWALDTRRHLALGNRYPLTLALPDRWQSWIVGGTLAGLRIARRWRPDAIMSTYPIASAHSIGYLLHRLTGVPWVAEFRDPMAQDGYPPEPRVHRSYVAIERKVFEHAARIVFATPGAADIYRRRFADYSSDAIRCIPNGFDPEVFPAEASANGGVIDDHPIRILHSGILYQQERNPTALFGALVELRREGVLSDSGVQFLFRASGNEDGFNRSLEEWGLGGMVRLLPWIPYRDAVQEMLESDACLVLQGETCNQQIPAKLYEYLRAARPILGLTDPSGDTGVLMRSLGIESIARLEDKDEIKRVVPAFLDDLRHARAVVPGPDVVERFSRRALTRDLGRLLDEVRVG